jgi:hypothetical protein
MPLDLSIFVTQIPALLSKGDLVCWMIAILSLDPLYGNPVYANRLYANLFYDDNPLATQTAAGIAHGMAICMAMEWDLELYAYVTHTAHNVHPQTAYCARRAEVDYIEKPMVLKQPDSIMLLRDGQQ